MLQVQSRTGMDAPLDHAAPPTFFLGASASASDLYHAADLPGGVSGDSGVDLRFAADVAVPTNTERDGLPVCVNLGVRARCVNAQGRFTPFQLLPRSSIGTTTPLSLANSPGLIEAGYQGEIMVLLRNHSTKPYMVARGTSLVQLVAPTAEPARLVLVSATDPLFSVPTERGDRGLGSTGIRGRC